MPVTNAAALGSQPDSQAVLRKILDATREGVLVVRRDMHIVAANTAANRAFAKQNELIENEPLCNVIVNTALKKSFQKACEKNETSDIHLENGNRRYDVHVAPLDLDGESLSAGFFYDVTQVHRLETIRQEFLSNISHELRTPLTSILAFVETLEGGALEDAEHNRHFLSVIRRNGERMRNLIADILELSQIESGNVSLNLRKVKLDHLVDEIFTSLSSMAGAREITLANDVEISSVIRADQTRLEQMLTNLVDNAIRFNRRGGSVTVADKLVEGKHHIYVSDTGEGILPEQINRIFERFYRADRARSREVGGTGLGLAIVKHLAKLHGGEVSAESQPGVGTTFTIELPF
jgi:two-component system phosphate regulon sensor histidine kinase PhoR